MTRYLRGLSLLALGAGCVFWAADLRADDASNLMRLAEQFESARTDANVEAMERLTFADAQWITEPDRKSSAIVADLKAAAKQRASNPNRMRVETLVAERDLQIRGETAVMMELVRVTSDRPQPPLRRSLFWSRDGDTWRIAHVHTSPYLRWETSISDYEKADKEERPETGGVVLIGSSSIRRWRSLGEDFSGLSVLNRGFGGSQMVDSVLFAKRIVTPYRPVAVAVYAGDNDIGGGKDAARVVSDFQNFVASVHAELPDSKIGFIAIKPSLKRWNLWPEMLRANLMVKELAEREPNVAYLDIATPMLGEDGTPRKGLFADDGLHLNEVGYNVWTDVIKPWAIDAASQASTGQASSPGAE